MKSILVQFNIDSQSHAERLFRHLYFKLRWRDTDGLYALLAQGPKVEVAVPSIAALPAAMKAIAEAIEFLGLGEEEE